MSSKKEIVCLPKRLHDVSLLLKYPRAYAAGSGASVNLGEVVETMTCIRQALEDQLEYKKKEKEDSKNRWSKLLSHH